MSFYSREELTENKLVLLYIIDKLSIPVTSLQLMKLVVTHFIMDGFMFQQLTNELLVCNLILKKTQENRVVYEISNNGKQALQYFSNRIPSSIKELVEKHLLSTKNDVKNELNIYADYTPEEKNEFLVHCYIKEDSMLLIELKLIVGSTAEAHTICNNWKTNPQKIYLDLVNSLLTTDKPNN